MRSVFCLFGVIALCMSAIAQQNVMTFNRLTTEMGLSNGDVRCISQDHYGYLWIGTTDGLNRYNGIEFEVFKNDKKDTTSLSNSYINYLYEDKKNNLWISTFGGLCRYDPKKNNFERIRFVDDHGKVFTTLVNCIVEDNSSNLWIGTLNGLFKFDRNKKLFLRSTDNHNNKLVTSNCTFICIDKLGAVWTTLDDGKNVDIFKLNPETKEFTSYTSHHPINKISNNTAIRLMADNDNNIWVGYYSGGIDVINEKNKTIQYYRSVPNDKNSLSSGFINSIIQDIDGNIYIGTRNGLNIYDPQKKSFRNFKSSESDKSLIGNEVTCLYASPQGTVWIGCWGSGVSIYDKRLNRFAHFKQDKDPKKTLNGTSVTSFAEAKDGRIWISTDGGGLNLFSPIDENFTPVSGTEKLTNNKILSLEKDHSEGLWTGMWEGGLNYFKTEENRIFLKQKYNYLDELNAKSNSVFKIYCDRNNDVYVATFSAGAYKFDTKTNNFKQIISKYSVLNIFRDSEDKIWFATLGNGLLRIDPQKGDTDVFITNPKDTTSLSSPTVNIVFEDSKKRIWVGVDYGGLNLFDRKKKTFTHFTTEQGLPDNSIVGILEDNSGNLWISSHGGLSKVKIDSINGKLKLTFRNYTVQDGLQSKVFNRWAYFKSKKGEMYFGGQNGFNVFKPSDIKDNEFKPPVFFTDFLLFNKSVTIGTENSPLKQDISKTSHLVLKYNQSFFTIRFVALNYIYSEKNQYAYRMEGFDQNWNYVENKREATYTNLNPGKYTFYVKASNNDGVWNETGTSIEIIILPPWWKTWWFKLIIGILMMACFVFITIRFINKIKKSANQTILNERNQLKTLINNIPDHVIIKDTKSRFIIVNKATINFFGVKSDSELIHKTDYELCPKELSDTFFKQELEILTTGIPLINDESTRIINGQETFLSATKCPIISEKGETIGLVCIIRDITTQKIAKQKIIKQSEELQDYNKLLNDINEALREASYSISEKAEAIVKLSEFGKKITATLNLDSINNIVFDYVSSFTDGTSLGIGIYDSHTESVFFPAFFEKGQPASSFRSFLTDTTSCAARCFNNQEVIFSNDFLNEYHKYISKPAIQISQTPASIIYVPLTVEKKRIGVIAVQSNKPNAYTSQDFAIIQTLSSYIAIALDNTNVYLDLEKKNQQLKDQADILNETNTQLEERQQQIEEQTEELRSHAENLKEVNDLLVENQRLIQLQSNKLEESNRELLISNSSKDRFFSIIAHDLRNPFHAVSGFSEILLRDYKKLPSEKVEKYLSLINKSSQNGGTLLENLLQWSRAQTGSISFEPLSINLLEVANNVLDLLALEAQQKNIQITQTVDPVVFVFADENMIHTILRNLISNAIKFTNERGKIILKATSNSQMVEVSVVDTGVGISHENLQLLFNVETNISTKGTASETGTGLGLILCKEFVERNGGKIWVKSTLNKGSEFIFTLQQA